MRLATCVIAAAAWLAALPARAFADDAAPSSAFRAVIDRVDLEPASVSGFRLRVGLSALTIQGQLLDLADTKSIKATIGGAKLDAPFAIGRYGATDGDTAIVIAIQANQPYADALPNLVNALEESVLAKLGERTQVAIVGYGEAPGTERKLSPLKTARGKLAGISSDGSAGEPALLDTIDGALRLLRKAKTSPEGLPMRKMIIVIGDGRDRAGDRDRVTRTGERADKDGVRIHTFGYAPTKILRALLTFGELSKRSLGTFRWVRSGGAESWGPAFQQLQAEISKQYVVTYFLPGDGDPSGRKLRLVTVGRTETTSNEIKIPDAKCGGEPCAGYCVSGVCAIPRAESSRGVLGWLGIVIGLVIGLGVVLGLIGYLMSRGKAKAPPVPGQPPGSVPPPGSAPPGSAPPKSRWGSKPPAQAPVVAPVAAPPVAGPVLMFMAGPRAGQRVALHHGFVIGKAPTSHLVIDDGYASTMHAQITMDTAGNCRLYDHNSTNGTFANGVRVTEVALDHGMTLRIGSTELRFLAQ